MFAQSFRWVIALATLGSVVIATDAPAQEFPNRPITLVVGVPAGGPADTTARVLAEGLRGRFNRPVIVENKPGAGTLIAARAVAAAEPDGHTLILGTPGISLFSIFVQNPGFDVERDLKAVAPFGEFAYVFAANSRFASLSQLVAYAKSNPGKLNFATYGIGSQILTRYMNGVLGIDAVEVPFGGSAPAHTALMSGTVDYIFTDVGTFRPVLDSGKGKLIAVVSPSRLKEFPDIITLREGGVDLENLKIWYAVFAPIKTPVPVIARLNREISAVAQMPEIKARLAPLNVMLETSSSEALQDYVRKERAFYVGKAKEMGIAPQ